MIAGFSRDELLHEALVVPRGARGDYPDIQVTERPGWFQILTPSFRQGGLNEVSFAQLDGDDIDATIDATIAQYEAHGLRFRWLITPDTRPADLGERLARRGMKPERVVVMAAAIADLRVDAPDDIVVSHVDGTNLDRYIEVNAAGWGLDPVPWRDYLRFLLQDPATPHHSYLAEQGGQAVGVANYAAFTRSAYLMGVVVLPQFRGRGAYRALLTARLRHAAALGLPLVTTHARASTSAPILARLGFQPLLELPMYFNR